MKKIGIFILKFLLITIAIVAILGTSICSSLSPAISSFKEIANVIEKYNQPVNTQELIYNTVSPNDITSTVEKFNSNGRDIFLNKSLNYSKMLPYNESEKVTINLTYSEFSFLQNSIKGCTDFLVDKNINQVVSKSIFIGSYSSDYFDKIMVKLDLGNIIENLEDIGVVKDNLYLSISKNYSGIYNYNINNLTGDDSKALEIFLNGYLSSDPAYKNYSLEALAKTLYDVYELQFEEFKKFVNVNINIE
ncbi:MAG: hypothetical protein IJW82_07695 [Clostridia bacterium]|nr:hypothetical protein [Clostridia bacterium]